MTRMTMAMRIRSLIVRGLLDNSRARESAHDFRDGSAIQGLAALRLAT